MRPERYFYHMELSNIRSQCPARKYPGRDRNACGIELKNKAVALLTVFQPYFYLFAAVHIYGIHSSLS